MTTAAAFTWADLDSSNLAAGHYARKPGYLLDAERNTRDAYAAEDALIDWPNVTPKMLERAHQHSLDCERIEKAAYSRWSDEQARRLGNL